MKAGQVDGKQYWIPWDSGYSSVMYRTDKIDPADATSWNLFWNPKYAGKISMWDGFTTPLVIAGLVNGVSDPYNMSTDEIEAAKQKLIEQKQVNKFYWKLEYDDMQPAFKSGDIWVTYAWPNDYNDMLAAGLKTGYMDPSEGRLAWYCGFIMLKSSQNYFHNHKYVDSFIGHDACVDLFNAFVYASANTHHQEERPRDPGPERPEGVRAPGGGRCPADRRSEPARRTGPPRAVHPTAGRVPVRLGRGQGQLVALMSEAHSVGRRRGFPFRRRWRPGRAWLSLPVTAYLLAGLIVPIILIALYSVHLLTNFVFPPAKFSLDTWKGFLPYLHDGTSVYFDRFKTSMAITLIVSTVAVLAAYPLAFYLAFVAHRRRYTLLLVLLAPFFVSYLLRVYAWTVMLSSDGTINSILVELGRSPGPSGRMALPLQVRDRPGARVLVDPVRRASDLRRAREPRQAHPRGRAGSRREPALDVLPRHAAAAASPASSRRSCSCSSRPRASSSRRRSSAAPTTACSGTSSRTRS